MHKVRSMRYLNNGLEADKMYQRDDVCLPGALLLNHQAVKLPGTWVGSSAGRQSAHGDVCGLLKKSAAASGKRTAHFSGMPGE